MVQKIFKKNKLTGYCLTAFFCVFGIICLGLYFSSASPKHDLKKQTFDFISAIRAEKKKEVIQYFEDINEQAKAINSDKKMFRFFNQMKAKRSDPELELEIDKYYVSEYGNFYDILFIDATGYIFHSIRKETDYRENIFTSDEISNSKLAQYLKKPGEKSFVEYEYYPPSNEAAAFFSVALSEKGKHVGWLVLQCETNKVNAILTDRKGLGRTGEVYLVNKEKLMLSESRFMEDSTILRQKVDTLAVKEAFLNKTGEKIIDDYRGVKVFSSFEMFELCGATWVMIVEIDESEIITEHFKKNKDYFIKEIVAYLSSKNKTIRYPEKIVNLKQKRVDMNEFAKVESSSYLVTEGVATCTAIAISYPGKFGYLAHISPTDEIYIDNIFTKYFLRKNYHNFLSDILGRVKHYEIYPYELSKLQVVIAAPHSLSFKKSVEALLEHEIELANIKFLYNPDALSGDMALLPPEYNVHVIWNEQSPSYNSSEQIEDLGDIVKKIIRYDA